MFDLICFRDGDDHIACNAPVERDLGLGFASFYSNFSQHVFGISFEYVIHPQVEWAVSNQCDVVLTAIVEQSKFDGSLDHAIANLCRYNSVARQHSLCLLYFAHRKITNTDVAYLSHSH